MMDLYCQSPNCNVGPISDGGMVQIDGALVHLDVFCIKSYQSSHNLADDNRGKVIYFEEAEKLAKKGKIKFSKLEKETASVGGMGQ